MKISVAMATYNGEKYLSEQLASILSQTRVPDELVICDDCSNDGTIVLINELKKKSHINIKFFINKKNIGYSKNFEKAVLNCSGDVIVFCDQDDIWYLNKLEVIENFFLEKSKALLIMHDALLFFSKSKVNNKTLLNQTLSLGMQLDKDFGLGCCMAFKRELADIAYPMPVGEFLHDVWLNKIAILLDGKFIIPNILMKYRRHSENTTFWIACHVGHFNILKYFFAWGKADSRTAAVLRLRELLNIQNVFTIKLSDYRVRPVTRDRLFCALKKLDHELSAIQARCLVLDAKSWTRLALIFIFYKKGYYNFFSGWKSCVKDIFCR